MVEDTIKTIRINQKAKTCLKDRWQQCKRGLEYREDFTDIYTVFVLAHVYASFAAHDISSKTSNIKLLARQVFSPRSSFPSVI